MVHLVLLLCFVTVCKAEASLWFALGDEDEDAEDDAGQSDTHASDDAGHGLLIHVVQAVYKRCGNGIELRYNIQNTCMQY